LLAPAAHRWKSSVVIHHSFKSVLIDWQKVGPILFGPYEGNPVPFETVVMELSTLGFDEIEEKKGRK